MKSATRRNLPRVYVREWMDHLKTDQTRLAERMGVSEGTLSKLMNGRMRMTLDYMSSISEAMNIPIQALYRDPAVATQADILSQLTPEKRAQAEEYIRFLASSDPDNQN